MAHIQMTDGNSSDLGLMEEVTNEELTDEELTDQELSSIDGGNCCCTPTRTYNFVSPTPGFIPGVRPPNGSAWS